MNSSPKKTTYSRLYCVGLGERFGGGGGGSSVIKGYVVCCIQVLLSSLSMNSPKNTTHSRPHCLCGVGVSGGTLGGSMVRLQHVWMIFESSLQTTLCWCSNGVEGCVRWSFIRGFTVCCFVQLVLIGLWFSALELIRIQQLVVQCSHVYLNLFACSIWCK